VTGMMRIPRSRGAVSGTLLVLLGVWGTFIPFVGPYFDYAYTPDNAWDYTTGRLLLEVLPGVGAVLGGLLVLGSANRAAATLGGWLAALSGAWFVLGVPLSTTWEGQTVGEPIGGTTRQAFEYVGFFGGLGVVIVFLATFALGRFAVVGVREVERAEQAVTPEERVTTQAAPEPEQEAEGRHRFRWRRSKQAGA
jgi:hypothetical protein